MKKLILCALILVTLTFITNAQSIDRNNPSPLTTKKISGSIDNNSIGKSYYYSFIVNPGELSIILSVESSSVADALGVSTKFVSFILFNEDGTVIAKQQAMTFYGLGPKSIEAKFNVTKSVKAIFEVMVEKSSVGTGSYQINIAGNIPIESSIPPVSSYKGDSVDLGFSDILDKDGSCLPKKGTLIIKMKDGTKKIIDLGEAETVTVVPEN